MTENTWQLAAFGKRLAYQNVLSSRATFHYSELGERFGEFTSAITQNGYDPKGPLFYSLNNVPLDEMVDIEMFLPIRQDSVQPEEGLLFHSYFDVSPLLSGMVTGDFEVQAEHVYAQLLATLDVNGLQQNTPFYHLVRNDIAPYVSVLVGYSKR
ncbi:DUF5085 family protein [Leifsonia sp. AG29]|uniref:DUF5085 family protein n=1 Tax=Leifsonia sp. AG29 TaxID=2598860 RepID=UPI00131D6495|nr:DUF5085 family protein [Leifsonia sp. AG29]